MFYWAQNAWHTRFVKMKYRCTMYRQVHYNGKLTCTSWLYNCKWWLGYMHNIIFQHVQHKPWKNIITHAPKTPFTVLYSLRNVLHREAMLLVSNTLSICKYHKPLQFLSLYTRVQGNLQSRHRPGVDDWSDSLDCRHIYWTYQTSWSHLCICV